MSEPTHSLGDSGVCSTARTTHLKEKTRIRDVEIGNNMLRGQSGSAKFHSSVVSRDFTSGGVAVCYPKENLGLTLDGWG